MLDKLCLPSVLVIDALELRRAGIVSLIEPCAESIGLATEAIAPEELPVDFRSEVSRGFHREVSHH